MTDLSILAASATVLEAPGYDQKRTYLFHYLPENRALVYLFGRSWTTTIAQKPPENGNGVAQSDHSMQAICLAMVRTYIQVRNGTIAESGRVTSTQSQESTRVALRQDSTRSSRDSMVALSSDQEGKGDSYQKN